ncbi:MAG: prolipoprotein diacylglyceryl transferase family protein, partial [Desulfofundulus sp.]
RRPGLKRGDVFLAYLVLYSLGRFWVEGFRTDSLMLGPLRVAQVVSFLLATGAGYLLWRRHRAV